MGHVVRITPADLGRRVTVRVITASGSATDVVGDLVTCTDDLLMVRDRDDVEHQLDRRRLLAGHVVRSTPAPRRVTDLERIAAAGWPAVDTEPFGEWLLRAAGGFTGRANSVLAIGDPAMPFDDAIQAVGHWYGERGLPTIAAVPFPFREDDQFAARGWTPGPAILVQTANIADLLARITPSQQTVELREEPSNAWLARYTARGEVTETGRAVITGARDVTFAQIRDGGTEPTAIGRGTVVDGWLGIGAIEVATQARRRGLASAITAALLEWGAERGAARAYLQVESQNRQARAMYEALGFRTHHRYRYRYPNEGTR